MATRRRRLKNTMKSPVAFWADMGLSAMATAATLSVRLPLLATGQMRPKERRRMVTEKIAAAGEGVMLGAAAAQRVLVRRLTKPDPWHAVSDMAEIVEAASRPARRRVKSNAKRLTTT